MRVIAGTARGRRLLSVPGRETRPTTDRVKEALFNIVGPQVAGARVLDLFAGTGALGIEALSRGAARAVFLDRAPAAVRVIRANLDRTGLAASAEVHLIDVQRGLGILARRGLRFNLVLLDPPYGVGSGPAALRALGEGELLAENALIVVEHGRREELPDRMGNLARVRTERYGETALSFYREAGEADGAGEDRDLPGQL